ncbi:MAG: cupredoxin domain-containing protein [Mariprofundaceae bacterium]|nr:cupredoxin domain-containing protein [Mariprofundaceae bacterium]
MKKTTLFITALAFIFTLSSIAQAQDYIINQKDKKFSQKKITIKLGEKITFVNTEDEIVHNIYSSSKGNSFEIRKQPPGSREVVEFKNKGKAKVRCAIHPKMKIKITIE